MGVTVAVALVLVAAPLLAQSFDAVSIRRNTSGAAASETETDRGRIRLINATPQSLVLRALGVRAPQVIDL